MCERLFRRVFDFFYQTELFQYHLENFATSGMTSLFSTSSSGNGMTKHCSLGDVLKTRKCLGLFLGFIASPRDSP